MASQFYTPKSTSGSLGESENRCGERVSRVQDRRVPELGVQPFNRDCPVLAFGKHARVKDGQQLAGTGALVFEGEVLELPAWN